MKKILVCLSLSAFLAVSTFAGDTGKAVACEKAPVVDPGCDCFEAGLRGGFFFSGLFPIDEGSGAFADDSVGGGISVDYFLTDMIGLSGSAAWYSTDSVTHNYSVDAILRYPIRDLCIAPYVLAGIGVHTDSSTEVVGRFGAGIELACPEINCTTLFADWIFTTENGAITDYHVVRLGLKFPF
jgi:hypothetical protein